MLVKYKPDYLPALASVYAQYAAPIPGMPIFPPDHWEYIFSSSELDPIHDVIITSKHSSEPDGFCFIYSPIDTGRVFLKGPYVSPQNPDLKNILAIIVKEATRRGADFECPFIESRAFYQEWKDAFIEHGYRLFGAYERFRLFPLKGPFKTLQIPNGMIRHWRDVSDLDMLMELFDASFSRHWDYVRSPRIRWLEVVKDAEFEPKLALFAFENSNPVGYAFGEKITDTETSTLEAAYLTSIAVIEKATGKGWGEALLSEWLRSCYALGLRAVELDVDYDNLAAKSLYRKFGFKQLRSESVFRYYYPVE